MFGIPDAFVEHGASHELYEICGYSPNDILNTAKKMMKPAIANHETHHLRILQAFKFFKQ